MEPACPPELPQAQVGPYILSHTLGEGTTGKVKLGIHRETGAQVAIKIIPKAAFSERPDLQLKVQREIALMRLVDHPNILKLRDVLESPRHLYIILEYAEQGELFDFLVSNRFLQEDVAMEFFRQIVFAVEYLHQLGICHRDLKPENILLDSCTRVKIADFGFARWVSSSLTETSCGSPHYAAPEIIRGQPYDGRVADIWSLGVILYALLAGYLPFDDPSIRNLLNKVKRGVFQMPPFPPEFQDLIRRMLTVDVEARITIDGIKAHPAFRNRLPSTYVVPSPLPLANFLAPMDPQALSEDVMDVLNQIGFNDREELAEQLQSSDNSMAKVFVAMLASAVDLEQLPWETAHAGPPKPLVDTSFVEGAGGAVANPVPGDDPLHREGRVQNFGGASLEMYSFAARPNWAIGETPATDVLDEVVFETFGIPVWEVMSRVQLLLGNLPFQWFHPNLVLIFARTQDGTLYVSVQATFKTSDDLLVTVKLHKGNAAQFRELAEQISLIVKQ